MWDVGSERELNQSFRDEQRVSDAKRSAQRSEYLSQFWTKWDSITAADARALKRALNSATHERDLQEVLEHRPNILVQVLQGGHGRWVIPRPRLGSKFEPDFLLAVASSIGMEWFGVELESPKHSLFTKKGDPRQALTHAIRQIQDWRNWLSQNLRLARAPRSEQGLEFFGIDAEISGIILIGRRKNTGSEEDQALRRRMIREHRIVIRSYDWLLEMAEHFVRS